MNETETNEETFSENEEVPLTKSKGGRPKKEVAPKEKKPRTEKQVEAMKKAFATRQANIDQKKLEKKIEASKLLLSLDKPLEKVKPKYDKKGGVIGELSVPLKEE